VPLPLRQFTAVAGKATEFASLFNRTFSAGFQGPEMYRIDLTAPDGPSTGGGKQALQHIRLVPLGGGPAIVIGAVNQVDMTAEMRTFRHLAELHARRFNGQRVPVDPNAYRELTRHLHQFFASQTLAVVMVDISEGQMSSRPPPAPATGGSQLGWIVAGVAIAFALGVGGIALLVMRDRAAAPRPSVTSTTAPSPS
jgi:hypothetical protein